MKKEKSKTPKQDKPSKKPFHIVIEAEIYDILKDYCEMEEKKLGDIVNEALDKFLQETKINPLYY